MRSGGEAIASFETKGTWLALFPKKSLAADANVPLLGSGSPGFTLAHNVRSKEEVDSLISHAVSVGATLVKPAQDAERGGHPGYFADPGSYLREVAWNPFFWIE